MNGINDALLYFCRTYLYYMADEIGLDVETNMEQDSEYAMSKKTMRRQKTYSWRGLSIERP